jgi:hypothetical protein
MAARMLSSRADSALAAARSSARLAVAAETAASASATLADAALCASNGILGLGVAVGFDDGSLSIGRSDAIHGSGDLLLQIGGLGAQGVHANAGLGLDDLQVVGLVNQRERLGRGVQKRADWLGDVDHNQRALLNMMVTTRLVVPSPAVMRGRM